MAEGKTITIVQKGKAPAKVVYFDMQGYGDTGGTVEECTFYVNFYLEEAITATTSIRCNATNRGSSGGMYSNDFTVTINPGETFGQFRDSGYIDDCDLVVGAMKVKVLSSSASGYDIKPRKQEITIN